MATKKQKRAAALAKREEFMAGVKADGLAAQAYDRAVRKIELDRVWDTSLKEIADAINNRHAEILEKASETCGKCGHRVSGRRRLHHPNYCVA